MALLTMPALASAIEARGLDPSGEIEITASCPAEFEDNRNVTIHLEVRNLSKQPSRILKSNGLEGVKVELRDSAGNPIPGYHEIPDSGIQPAMLKRRFHEWIAPGETASLDALSLSSMWPIKSAGNYTCKLSVTVETRPKESDQDHWIPTTILLPAFGFKVKEIAKDYTSPGEAAYVLGQRKSTAPAERGNPNHASFKIAALAMISLLAGLWWFLKLKRRRSQLNGPQS